MASGNNSGAGWGTEGHLQARAGPGLLRQRGPYFEGAAVAAEEA